MNILPYKLDVIVGGLGSILGVVGAGGRLVGAGGLGS